MQGGDCGGSYTSGLLYIDSPRSTEYPWPILGREWQWMPGRGNCAWERVEGRLTLYVQCNRLCLVKRIEWSEEKDKILISGRKVSFLAVAELILKGDILAMVKNPNTAKYPHQSMYLVNINDYVYIVPFVENDKNIFLKTIIPSRKATRDYLIKNTKNEKLKTK